MTSNDARKAHKILDDLIKGNMVLDEEREFLRRALPELPKQKTLAELTHDVYDAWVGTDGNDWSDGSFAEWVSPWLDELHTQLKGLETAAAPALPAGMRLADHDDLGRVVVSPSVGVGGRYEIFYLDPGMSSGTDISEVEPDSLTFIDDEPAKSAHPELLETEADYRDAPEGTVVVKVDALPWAKEDDNNWTCAGGSKGDYSMSLVGSRRVLRWGWGE